MSFDGRGVGIANATNTNTDTSARIHTTARVCVNLYNSLADPNLVQSNKAEFRAIKEEIALGLGRSFNKLGVSYAEQRGLAPIITNTTIMNSQNPDDLMRWLIVYYDCRSVAERKAHCATSCTVKGQAYYPSEFYFAGLVISDAEADPKNGDTALTLFIGGKMTIKNGHYPIQTGDEVMWYFEEEVEAGMFDEKGLRKDRRPSNKKQKVQFMDPSPITKQQKKVRDITYAERSILKRPAFIKPCIMGINGLGATRADRSRIIGTACSNAGSYERVDIKIGRHAL